MKSDFLLFFQYSKKDAATSDSMNEIAETDTDVNRSSQEDLPVSNQLVNFCISLCFKAETEFTLTAFLDQINSKADARKQLEKTLLALDDELAQRVGSLEIFFRLKSI